MKITQPQKSDIGSSFGYIENSHGIPLQEVLNWIESNTITWGIVTIYNNEGNIIRKFDYDLYNSNQFIHWLNGWQYSNLVEKVRFEDCFMCRDFDIYLQ